MKHVRHGLMEARPLFLGFSFVGNHASGFSFRGAVQGALSTQEPEWVPSNLGLRRVEGVLAGKAVVAVVYW